MYRVEQLHLPPPDGKVIDNVLVSGQVLKNDRLFRSRVAGSPLRTIVMEDRSSPSAARRTTIEPDAINEDCNVFDGIPEGASSTNSDGRVRQDQ